MQAVTIFCASSAFSRGPSRITSSCTCRRAAIQRSVLIARSDKRLLFHKPGTGIMPYLLQSIIQISLSDMFRMQSC